MKLTFGQLKELINEKLPEGSVIPDHDEKGHFYKVPHLNARYPSVTGKLQILKDPSIMKFNTNRAIDYVFAHWKEFTDENVMDHLYNASNAGASIFKEAGDIGTEIHECREGYFKALIDTPRAWNEDTPDFKQFIKEPYVTDGRFYAAMGGINKFVRENYYRPLATEMYVYSKELGLAGQLDDIGVMWKVVRKGRADCEHEIMQGAKPTIWRCFNCEWKAKDVFVMLDLKTSNQFKDHYFFQVALYHYMFRKIVGIKPDMCFILKPSKEHPTYSIETMYQIGWLERGAKHVLKVNDALELIKKQRKDYQKNIVKFT